MSGTELGYLGGSSDIRVPPRYCWAPSTTRTDCVSYAVLYWQKSYCKGHPRLHTPHLYSKIRVRGSRTLYREFLVDLASPTAAWAKVTSSYLKRTSSMYVFTRIPGPSRSRQSFDVERLERPTTSRIISRIESFGRSNETSSDNRTSRSKWTWRFRVPVSLMQDGALYSCSQSASSGDDDLGIRCCVHQVPLKPLINSSTPEGMICMSI